MASERRLAVLGRQLTRGQEAIVPRDVYLWLVRDNVELRDRMLEHLKDPLYKGTYDLSLKDFRALTLRRLQLFTQQRFFRAADYLEDPARFFAALELAGLVDYSLTIKAGVHFTLCGGSLCNLGTARHHAAYLSKLDTLEERGCFAMTELGHGSNVMGIETTAVFEPESDCFVLHTPSNTASKFWIGGAGSDATISTVFAQLSVRGRWVGPHVFVVRLRDSQGRVLPGVRVRDNGPKAGLNGVDNGQIWFDRLRVPRDALLDRYASVSPEGVYSSPIASVGARFGTMVGGLTAGRLLIAQGAIEATKTGVTIALRYAASRPQFGDTLILSYLTHQRRLLPALAGAFAFHLAMLRLKALYLRKDPKAAKALHVQSSGLKAGATWARAEALQHCRECCGGLGFLSANKIGPLKNDMDVDQTFEGDNTVMMQQVSKALLEARAPSEPAPQPPAVADAELTDHAALNRLLAFREAGLTAEIQAAVQAAVRAAGPAGAKAAAAAAADDSQDLAVQLGWAFVDRLTFSVFAEELASAPAPARPLLGQLASLHGLTRVERALPFFLASGALRPRQAGAVRAAVNGLCRGLAADARALLALCDGFGIPDELLDAPIAQDWRAIGA